MKIKTFSYFGPSRKYFEPSFATVHTCTFKQWTHQKLKTKNEKRKHVVVIKHLMATQKWETLWGRDTVSLMFPSFASGYT